MANFATDGSLPKDVLGNPSVGVYAPGVGTVALGGGPVSTDVNNQPSAPAKFVGTDGLNPALLWTVAQFHNADNQQPGATAYGLLTGGVAQLLNILGNLDRQRETGADGIPAQGLSTGAAQFAMFFKTTDTIDTKTAGTNTFTPVAMSGTTQGVAWSIQVGSVLSLDVGANQEYTVVTATTATTFTCVTTKTHTATFQIVGFVYNQERDAAGELDGASGIGTAVAAEYEYNGGGPLNNANAISNLQFDRARNVQALGLGSGTISNNPLAAGSTTLTLNVAPTTLQPGVPIILDRAGANPETNYVALNYVVGSTSVPLLNATAFSHAQNSTVEWGQHSALGAQLNGFLPWGLGAEEEVLYDPVSRKYFVEIAATGDANSGQNLPLENAGLYNGATFDRQRAVSGDAMAQIGIEAATDLLYNGATYDRPRSATADALPTTGVPAESAVIWNGATFDRQRGNQDNIALVASAAYTTTQITSDQTNYNARGIIVTLDMTNVAALPSVTLEIDMKDPVSGKYIPLLTGAAVTTVSTNIYTVYPGAPATANVSANSPLPRTWRVKVTANNANSGIYSVGASLIV